ncbi:MAG: endonuclease/exonuclease/phosphatase family protein [Planctomycetes bacterium]|nr:endonuclease/exonuclease/phosphatase family protein [Planctomycetota bacterium]
MSLLRPSGVLCALILLATMGIGQEAVRVATWNIQAVGTPGSNEWLRSLDVVARLDADIVAIQEVDDMVEVGQFASFAAAAGYAHYAISNTSGTLSGDLFTAVLSRHPILGSTSHTAASLSGDLNANDITRDIFEARIQVPNTAAPLAIFTVHLKASSGGVNDFRRTIEMRRLGQAVQAFSALNPLAPFVITGDFNEDLGDGPFGQVFNALPSGLPQTYTLGNDINFPVVYDPFNALTTLGGLIADATQEDSTTLDATRDSSGRRLDYIIYGQGALLVGDEVYNSSRDNGLDDFPAGNWLPKAGSTLPASWSLQTSDHFPVFADLTVPGQALPLFAGSNDDFEMLTGVGAAPTAGPGQDQKSAMAGDFLHVRYRSPGGTFVGWPAVIVGEGFPFPGIPPFGPLPGMWFDLFGGAFALFDGTAATGGFQPVIAPLDGNQHSYLVPAGLGGTSFMLQSLAISNLANNGFLAFSDGHRVDILP